MQEEPTVGLPNADFSRALGVLRDYSVSWVSPSQAARRGAPLPKKHIGRERYVVPSRKLNLVQISTISAVIFNFNEADHERAAGPN
jgi:hypothetical protein